MAVHLDVGVHGEVLSRTRSFRKNPSGLEERLKLVLVEADIETPDY